MFNCVSLLQFVFGVCSILLVVHLLSFVSFVVAAVIGITALLLVKLTANIRCLLLLFVLFGAFWAQLSAWHVASWNLPRCLAGKAILIQGKLISIPQQYQKFSKFIFKIKKIQNKSHDKTNMQLVWYGKHPELYIGDVWQLLVKVKPAHGFCNSEGFDYEKYLFAQKIRAIGYVKASSYNRLLASRWYSYPIARLREYLFNGITRALHASAVSGVIAALVVGVHSHITKAQWRVFQATGTSHLVAISGLHVGLIYAFIFLFLKYIFLRANFIARRVCVPVVAACGALGVAISYSLLAGFSLSTERAIFMLGLFTLALILRRQVKIWYLLLLSVAIMLAFNPLAVLMPGFWLSCCSVAMLIYAFGARYQVTASLTRKIWWRWGRPQLVMMFALAPLTLLWFKQASLLGVAANIVAIPVVGCLVVPFVLLASLLLLVKPNFAAFLLQIAAKLLQILWFYLQWLAKQEQFIWHHQIVSSWTLLLALSGIVITLAPKGFVLRWLGPICCLPLLFHSACTFQYTNRIFILSKTSNYADNNLNANKDKQKKHCSNLRQHFWNNSNNY